jgi:DNA-binding transcriptional ArsR family regulator
VIDRIRHDIQQRLEQLLAEADKLRGALAALDPRDRPAAAATPRTSSPARAGVAKAPSVPRAERATGPSRPKATAATNGAAATRTPPGQTRGQIVAALAGGQALTAGEVAKATGLARPTVSTTLSKLSKTGEVVKADRGYRLPG